MERVGDHEWTFDRARPEDGDAMLQLALDAYGAYVERIRLYTNEAMSENLTYYPRRGYRETDRRTEDGYRRVYFEKQLDA